MKSVPKVRLMSNGFRREICSRKAKGCSKWKTHFYFLSNRPFENSLFPSKTPENKLESKITRIEVHEKNRLITEQIDSLASGKCSWEKRKAP